MTRVHQVDILTRDYGTIFNSSLAGRLTWQSRTKHHSGLPSLPRFQRLAHRLQKPKFMFFFSDSKRPLYPFSFSLGGGKEGAGKERK